MKTKNKFVPTVLTFGVLGVSIPILTWLLPTVGAFLHVSILCVGCWCVAAVNK